MVFSYYLKYPFYNAIWHILKFFRKKKRIILYCEDAFDVYLFQNVGKYLKDIEVVAKNKSVKKKLEAHGYTGISTMPAFPDVVIMFRNKAWKFPCKKIKKIGFTHGAFSFKKHSKAEYFNMFDLFFLTSKKDIENLRALGDTTKLAVAYPKIDSVFDNNPASVVPISDWLVEGSNKINLDKKTLFFASTWDGSGMSAIYKWYDKISLLTERFNLLVSVHEWMSEVYIKALKQNPDVYFIEDFDRLKYIKIADVCINDTSSLIAECCLFDKPLITFCVADTKRTLPDVVDIIKKISVRINDFEELENAIDFLLQNPDYQARERKEVAEIFFDKPDGNAGKRAAEMIFELISRV